MAYVSDQEQIDRLIGRFFEQFDNRGGKVPSLEAFHSLFSSSAIIVHDVGNRCEKYSVREFLEPRIRHLTTGELTEFHEWETSAVTHVVGLVASRESTYSKYGLRHVQPYDGKGSKFFQLGCFRDGWRITAIAWSDHLRPQSELG